MYSNKSTKESNLIVYLLVTILALVGNGANSQEHVTIESSAVSSTNELFTIYGKVNIRMDESDLDSTRIIVDDGQHVAFLRADGTFTIPGLASNSYVVEISSPRNVYEPVRVDINSKGKIRTRRLNLIQPSDVTMLGYPLKFESKGYPNYFLKREQFRVLDILLSPMVLMMVVPLLLVVVLPKLVNQDPELQRELQQSTNILQPGNQQMPNLSELMFNMFEGGSTKKKPTKSSRSDAGSTKKNK